MLRQGFRGPTNSLEPLRLTPGAHVSDHRCGLELDERDVVNVLARTVAVRCRPRTIEADEGNEFVFEAMDRRVGIPGSGFLMRPAE